MLLLYRLASIAVPQKRLNGETIPKAYVAIPLKSIAVFWVIVIYKVGIAKTGDIHWGLEVWLNN